MYLILFYYIFYFRLFQSNISELIRHLKKTKTKNKMTKFKIFNNINNDN